MQLESRTADRAGTLAYGVAGEGPPVVLLHGWPETGHCWRDVWPSLVAAGRRVVVPDLRGVGASDRSPGADYSWCGYAEDLDAILAAERIDRCALVGHDMGGVVMFEWALRNHDRVERVAADLDQLQPLRHAHVVLPVDPAHARARRVVPARRDRHPHGVPQDVPPQLGAQVRVDGRRDRRVLARQRVGRVAPRDPRGVPRVLAQPSATFRRSSPTPASCAPHS